MNKVIIIEPKYSIPNYNMFELNELLKDGWVVVSVTATHPTWTGSGVVESTLVFVLADEKENLG